MSDWIYIGDEHPAPNCWVWFAYDVMPELDESYYAVKLGRHSPALQNHYNTHDKFFDTNNYVIDYVRYWQPLTRPEPPQSL